MSTRRISRGGTALLPRLREPAPPRPEQCACCGRARPAGHRHPVDVAGRAPACAACGLLVHRTGAAGGRYRTVPDRSLAGPAGAPDERARAVPGLPAGTAFPVCTAAPDRLPACYPGPAGGAAARAEPDALLAPLAARACPLPAEVTA
ncbi:DUF5947 family protein [Kitasatospora sp. NPDC018619]|uniref:DUF5947 family protein n=1 Tax=unclassified Kitasatospora TaxID=2633591 RepID=UPI0037BDD836